MKNIVELLRMSEIVSTFVVLQFFIIYYAYGIFYTHKGTYVKIYRQVVPILYLAHGIIKNCSKWGTSCLSLFNV
jgi:hypothetical protein